MNWCFSSNPDDGPEFLIELVGVGLEELKSWVNIREMLFSGIWEHVMIGGRFIRRDGRDPGRIEWPFGDNPGIDDAVVRRVLIVAVMGECARVRQLRRNPVRGWA
jgi:hypothetical protein